MYKILAYIAFYLIGVAMGIAMGIAMGFSLQHVYVNIHTKPIVFILDNYSNDAYFDVKAYAEFHCCNDTEAVIECIKLAEEHNGVVFFSSGLYKIGE